MKKIVLFATLFLFTSLSFAQNRGLVLVKAPTENLTNEKRKAIVIGMSDYGGNKSLNNTLNDANDMAVFYFAGHGVEVAGENYLIPVDAELNSEADVRYNTLPVNKVLDNAVLLYRQAAEQGYAAGQLRFYTSLYFSRSA